MSEPRNWPRASTNRISSTANDIHMPGAAIETPGRLTDTWSDSGSTKRARADDIFHRLNDVGLSVAAVGEDKVNLA